MNIGSDAVIDADVDKDDAVVDDDEVDFFVDTCVAKTRRSV